MAIDKLQTDALSNTVTATVASFAIGANVSINSSAVFFGNSTINTVMTASSLTIANVSLNSSTIVIGSGKIAAGGVTLPSNFGVSSNTTNLLENRGGQLFFNGRRVDLVNEYGGTNPAVYGYVMGGFSGANVTTADRITFSTSVTAAYTAANLTTARNGAHGVSDMSIYGYVVGGGYTNTAERITFSTGVTAASTVTNSSVNHYLGAEVSDGVSYGYIMGGETAGSTYITTADRITFSTSISAASAASNLSLARAYFAGSISDGTIYGYMMGGSTNSGASAVATTDRITFSTAATVAYTAGNLRVAIYGAAALSDGVIYGYVGAGYTGAMVATAERLTFATSVLSASTISNLTVARYLSSSVSDGVVYGYWSGDGNGYKSSTDRITFSTSATAAYSAANLSQARGYKPVGVSDGAV